jgi:hypothetical protein
VEVPVVVVLVAAAGEGLLADDRKTGAPWLSFSVTSFSAAQITNSPGFDLGAGMCEQWGGAPATPVVVGASRAAARVGDTRDVSV